MSSRLSILSNHLSSRFPPGEFDPSLDIWRKKSSHLCHKAILEEYLGPYHEYIQKVRDYMSKLPLFDYHEDSRLSSEALREKVLKQLASMTKAFEICYDKDISEPLQKSVFLYMITEYDLGCSVRLGVHMTLYLDSLISFGTEKHRVLIDRCYSLKDIGCFGMTELGHGSNVAGVEVTATYHQETHGFIIHSPTRTSAKWWIGALGKTANMAIVWAQLIVQGVNHGVHMFVVPIRDAQHQPFKGLVIGDCGPKTSLQGIDNGFILFNNYHVPYDCLLDKISQITPGGKFKSSVKNNEKRLGIMIGAIIKGRNTVIGACSITLANALTCAIRYSAVRKQFAPDGKQEVPILSYQAQKVRLMPVLAQCFASRCATNLLLDLINKNHKNFSQYPEGEELAEFHAILSGLKGITSWYALNGAQVCRESCGGHGYSAFSSLGRLRDNQEVQVTWEGDNTVLIQQTSKYIIKQIQRSMKGHRIYSQHLQFLKLGHDDSKKNQINSNEDQIQALQHVVNLYLNESLSKLQELVGNGGNMTEVWNNTQSFLLQELSKSFSELILLKEVTKMAEAVAAKDLKTGEVFRKIRDLYGFFVLDKYFGALVEVGYAVAHRKVFRDRIISLCEEVAEVSVGIIDAIAPSDRVLSSSIGCADGQVYSRIIELTESWPEVYSTPSWLPTLMEVRGIGK